MNARSTTNHLRVLVINGCGVRGILPARILQEMTDLSEKNITDLFDYIIGTSMGGIEAIALKILGADGKPKYVPEDVVNILLEEAQEIYPIIFNNICQKTIMHLCKRVG